MKAILPVYLLILLMLAGSCKSHMPDVGAKVDKARLIPAMDELKKALATKDASRISKFIPSTILREEGSEMPRHIQVLNSFFQYLDSRGLRTSDTVLKSFADQEGLCTFTYAIEIVGDSIVFDYRSDSNPAYKATEDEEIDQSSECEHMLWYNFKLIQGQMRLTSIGGAD